MNYEKITYKMVKESKEVNAFLEKGNESLGVLGYTEHSRNPHLVELAKIAGYMHDIGNCVNRHDHPHSGAIMAFTLLNRWNVDPLDTAVIVSAIGQHDERTGTAVDPVSAALILADKTDVRRNRVRNQVKETFDKHDRVNYAALSSKLIINAEDKTAKLKIVLDENISSIMDYFEIFMQRMLMCKRASELLGLNFKLIANGRKIC